MPQAAKETVDITSLIKGIINGYPSSAIPWEYLQNSDDAKANKQVSFLIHFTFHPLNRLPDFPVG